MQLQVLLFAHYADRFGASALTLELPGGASVAAAVAAVRAMPGGQGLTGHPLTAVNERWAPPEQPLADGDVLALLPPVAGG